MKKISGKALSLVLSLALVVSSFSALPVSATTTHTEKGTLSSTDHDKIYAVNGEKKDSGLVVTSDLESYIFDQGATVKDDKHEEYSANIREISHASGDRLVKWYDAGDADKGSIDADTTTVGLRLRSDSVKGHEVLNVLYQATYTDEDEKQIVLKASKQFDVYVYDKNQPVIGDLGKTKDVITDSKRDKTIELTDDFAQKEWAPGNPGKQDIKTLSVYVAEPKSDDDGASSQINWTKVKTVMDGTKVTGLDPSDKANAVYYTLKCSGNGIDATDVAGATGDVVMTAKGSNSGSITFTAKATDYSKNLEDQASPVVAELSTTKDVTVKSKVEKQIKISGTSGAKIEKVNGSTWLAAVGTSLNSETVKDSNKAVKVNGYDVNFDDSAVSVNVAEKASVSKISGKVSNLSISSGSVGSVALDNINDTGKDTPIPTITVSEAKVGNIDFDDKLGDVTVDSPKATVGDVTDANDITVTSGRTGSLTADDKVDIKADDDDSSTVVGDITTKTLTIDSEDSKVTTGTIKAKSADSDFTLTGDSISVKGFDFDNYSATLEFDDFQGSVPAPKNASQDGATIQTTNGDDKVEVTGDADLDAVTVEEDSTLTFDGKLNVTSVDGSGKLVVGAGKMYIDGSVNGAVLKLSDPNFAKGTTVLTAAADCVEPDDFDTFGFTLAKTSGSKTDTFKIDSIEFKGLAINKANSEIAKGYNETFTAGSYPAGLTLPAGYKVQWSLDDANDSVFELTTNANGTATVKAIGFDTDFASENKATLTATLVDENGDTNDDYTEGECALTALLTPAQNFKSDTTGDVKMNVGGAYQFKITSLDGTVPAFGLGSTIAAVTSNSKSGNDYFYKVTAKQAGDVGVYVNNTRVAILRISAASAKIDTTSVKIKVGGTYQFKVTSATKPAFGFGSSALQTVSTSNQGQDYFYKVKAVSGKTGDQVGVYVNGSRAAIVTIG